MGKPQLNFNLIMSETAPVVDAPVVPEVSAKAVKKPAAKKAAPKKAAPAKKAQPIGLQIEEILTTTLKSRTGASSKKIIAALESRGIPNKPAIKRSLKALLDKGVIISSTGTGLAGSVKINPEESARRKKAAAAEKKAATAKKAAAAKKKKKTAAKKKARKTAAAKKKKAAKKKPASKKAK